MDIYELLFTKDYSELSDDEKKLILSEMSRIEYIDYQSILKSGDRIFQAEYDQIKLSPQVEQQLKKEFRKKHSNPSLHKSKGIKSSAFNWNFYHRTLKVSAIFLILLVVAYAIFDNTGSTKSEIVYHDLSDNRIMGFEEMDQYLMNVELCLDLEIVVPDIYGVPYSDDLMYFEP